MGGKSLVLGGGGIAGLGWLAGLISGFCEKGVDLRDADRMFGTSAGAATAAQLRSSQSIDTLFARQSDPALIADEAPPSMAGLAEAFALYPAILALADHSERMAAIGEMARRAKTADPEVRRVMIERRLSSHNWPEAHLAILAFDIDSGRLVAFDRTSGVALVDAVSASCAVPGVWPTVFIGAREFMDGGVYSADNAQFASGSDRVVIASPLGDMHSFAQGYRLSDQVAQLEAAGSKVMIICPNDAARAAMGPNPLDPDVRVPSAMAGRDQGRKLAAQLSAFWI